MEQRPLGSTGIRVPVLALGCGRLSITAMEEQEALTLLQRALELGVTYWDTATSYGQGESERRIGRVLAARRGDVFLATKIDARSQDAAAQELEESLNRLGVDHVDLLQLHGVNDNATLERVLAPQGALRALEAARHAGKVRYIGITGHQSPAVLARALESYAFDTVLMPVGSMDHLYGDFLPVVGPAAARTGAAILGMKVFGHGAYQGPSGLALRHALQQPVAAAVVGMSSVAQLEENVRIAEAFTPLSPAEQAELAAAARQTATLEQMWWRQPVAAR
ncbi:MAG: aldo/keto reductase [Chloroflexi bacterium]|nr:aldo/keto reductase [Chloroflexota bacterium]